MRSQWMKSTGMTPTPCLTFDMFYPHPPERVWRALTDPDALAHWLLPSDFRPRPGHRFQFRGRIGRDGRSDHGPETVRGEVLTVDKPHRLAYTWQSERDPAPSLVSWTLVPVDGGTHLQLEHTVLSGPEDLIFRAEATMNWQAALTVGLPSVLGLPPARRRAVGVILLPYAAETLHCVGRRRIPLRAGRI